MHRRRALLFSFVVAAAGCGGGGGTDDTDAEPHLREQAVEAGLRLVRERYSWDRVVDRLATLYAEVIEERAVGSARRRARARP